MSDPGIVSGPIAPPAHGPGGLFSNPALGDSRMPPKRRSKSAQRRATATRRKADANPHATAGQVISGALVRGPDGHFMRAGGSNPKLFGKSDAQKKQEAADKKQQAKDAAKRTAASAAAKKVGMSEADLEALRNAADGTPSRSNFLEDAGLIGTGDVTTADGDKALAALERGDARGYRAVIRRMAERDAKRGAAEQAKLERRRAAAQAKRDTAQRQADATAKRTADRQATLDARRAAAAERQAASDAKRQASDQAKQDAERAKLDATERTARDTADQVGLGGDGLDALRAIAEGRAVPLDYGAALAQLGLAVQVADEAYEATPEGRKALTAVEKGDLRGWQAAMQAARAKLTKGKAFWADLTALVYKHGKHDQSTHGRKGRAGKAGASAYAQARAGGASHQDALGAAKQATATERTAMRAEAAQKRTDRLTGQAAHARQVAAGSQVTPAQAARLNDKAARLEARARGERVGPKVTKPVQETSVSLADKRRQQEEDPAGYLRSEAQKLRDDAARLEARGTPGAQLLAQGRRRDADELDRHAQEMATQQPAPPKPEQKPIAPSKPQQKPSSSPQQRYDDAKAERQQAEFALQNLDGRATSLIGKMRASGASDQEVSDAAKRIREEIAAEREAITQRINTATRQMNQAQDDKFASSPAPVAPKPRAPKAEAAAPVPGTKPETPAQVAKRLSAETVEYKPATYDGVKLIGVGAAGDTSQYGGHTTQAIIAQRGAGKYNKAEEGYTVYLPKDHDTARVTSLDRGTAVVNGLTMQEARAVSALIVRHRKPGMTDQQVQDVVVADPDFAPIKAMRQARREVEAATTTKTRHNRKWGQNR